jgi:2TM domain
MMPEEQAPEELMALTTEEGLRERAVQRLRKQADFRAHMVIYLATNALLVAIWWFTGAAFFWPVFAIFGWGIGLVAHAWDAYGPDRLTEPRIQAEIDRLRK